MVVVKEELELEVEVVEGNVVSDVLLSAKSHNFLMAILRIPYYNGVSPPQSLTVIYPPSQAKLKLNWL
jgi:hypothetical protein